MDRISSMQAFVKAVELGSFSAAGDALQISSQLVGRHVHSLEQKLQARLLNRSTRRQSLTDVGRAFYERAKLVLIEVELAESVVAEALLSPSGRLRINAPVSFGMHALSPVLPRYMEAHPQVELELNLTNRVVDFIDDGYDVLFRVGQLSNSGLVARPLNPYLLILCATPSYLAVHLPIKHPRDLSTHECLVFTHTELRTQWQFSGPAGLVEVQVNGRYKADHGEVLLSAALAHMGVLLQSEELVRPHLASGALVEILPEYSPLTRPLHVLFAQDKLMTPKVRSFVDFAVATFGGPV
ncbi:MULTISPECIES: LysR family transcriptional regulator [unclassified Pseudomonas]|uniref:LysR family transcriptional regulator n=1 Tax=unclassified Pseudomonas TaxID=196821 RepID=UPI00235F00C8|nr:MULTISPECIES: LysR family transcriptional regulator [unclassified Pseudomonas]